ncbi:GNAT family N-acetyltransferase [Oceanotoga sp. DSM 15011]|uniref:GNAT family N-acetyltransferase n=1 Tax=Oceanotoga sp. DSM 15011 TaxID=2984951 RepID=UPI0021F3D121|nr:GNAT family N-acetyltransferase [Oceanotoga sp. DSM 15011]UYO99168.1 GNAT family N-acetyltransferase [Oceanotoga sp. DSM 15011]
MKKIKIIISIINFLFINLFSGIKLSKFKIFNFENYCIKPLDKNNFWKILTLYQDNNLGLRLNLDKKILYKFLGKKYCYIIIDKRNNTFVGMGMYYFNRKDIKEKTIHEGYIGLKKEYREKGLGTISRKYALEHFSKLKFLKGVSSRVSLDNIPSLKGNLKLGFKIEKNILILMKKKKEYI